jgi:hypothetical protein
MMMLAFLAALLLASCAFAAFGSQLLLGWYLHEARHLDVPQHPADAVITYPLA